MRLGREERHRRRVEHDADGRELVGGARNNGQEPRTTSRVAGRTSNPPYTIDSVEPVLEAGRDAEVAPTTTHSPEQLGLLFGAGSQSASVGGHDVDRQEVVDGHAVFPHEVADAPSQRQPAQPHRPRVTERRHQPVFVGGGSVFARREPGPGPGRRRCDIDGQLPHGWTGPAQSHRPRCRGRRGCGPRCAPRAGAASRRRRPRSSRCRSCRRPHDQGRMAIVSRVPDLASLVVRRIARRNDAAAHPLPKDADRCVVQPSSREFMRHGHRCLLRMSGKPRTVAREGRRCSDRIRPGFLSPTAPRARGGREANRACGSPPRRRPRRSGQARARC